MTYEKDINKLYLEKVIQPSAFQIIREGDLHIAKRKARELYKEISITFRLYGESRKHMGNVLHKNFEIQSPLINYQLMSHGLRK